MIKRKRLLILGATGSIGRAVQSVLREQRDNYLVVGFSAATRLRELISVAREWNCESLALASETLRPEFEQAARSLGIRRIYVGADAIEQQAACEDYDLLVNAVVGGAGIMPTIAALNRGIAVAFANKEMMVAAGPIVTQMARENHAQLLPIDSEHSAIFQCLAGENPESVRRLWLTTSGGPFWDRRHENLSDVTVEHALSHPTWQMGAKITIDSATLFNKGLEIIEAERLFGVPSEKILVVRHAQSIVHSMVEFGDGSIKAQLSVPDMRLPILVALAWPERLPSQLVETNTADIRKLTFDPVVESEFPCLQLARQALSRGGTAPAILSAADEIAVQSFLSRDIRFTDIPYILGEVLDHSRSVSLDRVSQLVEADHQARVQARESIERLKTQVNSLK